MVKTFNIDDHDTLQKLIRENENLDIKIEDLRFEVNMLRESYEKLNSKINIMKNDYR